ncbi:unnamed protein product [Owenia fusiformis]|uniref:Ectopic P granules protein 5 homolog n=1 Tax=Owenia fusiformis TaxID=6347 RepID=A0A8S4P4H1_OWEFU|nr:unnamed protein product [Owenia fusiformis]
MAEILREKSKTKSKKSKDRVVDTDELDGDVPSVPSFSELDGGVPSAPSLSEFITSPKTGEISSSDAPKPDEETNAKKEVLPLRSDSKAKTHIVDATSHKKDNETPPENVDNVPAEDIEDKRTAAEKVVKLFRKVNINEEGTLAKENDSNKKNITREPISQPTEPVDQLTEPVNQPTEDMDQLSNPISQDVNTLPVFPEKENVYLAEETPSEVTELPSEVTELPSEVTELTSEVTELPSEVTELPSEVHTDEAPQEVNELPTSLSLGEISVQHKVDTSSPRSAVKSESDSKLSDIDEFIDAKESLSSASDLMTYPNEPTIQEPKHECSKNVEEILPLEGPQEQRETSFEFVDVTNRGVIAQSHSIRAPESGKTDTYTSTMSYSPSLEGIPISREEMFNPYNVGQRMESEVEYIEAPQIDATTGKMVQPQPKANEVSANEEIIKVDHRKLVYREEHKSGEVYKPLTEEQLRTLYYNPMLEQNAAYIETFLQEVRKDKGEFYELVANYYRARNNLYSAEHDIGVLQNELAKLMDIVWTWTQHNVTAQGFCGDDTKVSAVHTYEKANFDEEATKEIARVLSTIRTNVHYTEMSLHGYMAAMARLQVEFYIHEMYMHAPVFRDLPRNSPVQGMTAEQRDPKFFASVQMCRHAITVLFEFQRKPAKDQQFLQDTRMWLQRLVASLLRVATLEDHVFLLNHILRCPSGMGKWCAQFLQVLSPPVAHDQSCLGHHLLDHFVNLLATIMMPISAREDFLYQMKHVLTPSVDKTAAANPWIFVDSDGEEDEEVEKCWFYLNENDIVALLNQFPIQDMFRHLLLIYTDEEQDVYNPLQTSETGMLKLLAFATCLIKLYGEGLNTFNMSRYRQLNKRIGKMIRQAVCFVCDHWQNFKYVHNTMPQSTVKTIQAEVDQFFLKATYQILSANRLGSWQFMADMPYIGVSISMMWKLLWLLHRGYDVIEAMNQHVSIEECKFIMQDPSSKSQFQDKLIAMSTSEAIYLLTAFANMARSRPHEDDGEYVKAIATEMFEIAYISSHTREFCSKVGRELLSSIASEHPFIISELLHYVSDTISRVGMVSLYLFKELPIHLWLPTDADIAIVKNWLLNEPLTSPQHQLSRLLVGKMNWAYNRQEDALFLPLSLHRSMALLLYQVYHKHITERNIRGVIADSVTKVTSVVRTHQTNEQQLSDWVWDVTLSLHLHGNNQPQPSLTAAPSVYQIFQRENLPDTTDPELYLIKKGMKDYSPLASYIALTMTKIGHSIEDVCSEGISLILCLVNHYHYIPAIHTLAYIMPLFVGKQEYLITNERFLHLVQSLTGADQNRFTKGLFQEFPGPVLKLLLCMIQVHIEKSSILPGDSGRLAVLHLWLTILTHIQHWQQDRGVLCVVDSVIKAAYRTKGGAELVATLLYEKYTNFVKPDKSSTGLLSSMVSWLASGSTLPEFISGNSSPEFPWFAYFVLQSEAQYEEDSGLWRTVVNELNSNPAIGVDQAVKIAAQSLKLESSPTGSRLCISRWLYQALDTDLDHPLLPLFWQRFFTMYLGRMASEPGLPQRGSMGLRFFDSMSGNTLLKRIQKRLQETAKFHHTKATELQHKDEARNSSIDDEPNEGDENINNDDNVDEDNVRDKKENAEYKTSRDFRLRLVRLYETFVCWAEESRLHDPNLYIPALPQQFDSERLLKVFQYQQDPWLEFIDLDLIDYELLQLVTKWVTHANTGYHGNRREQPVMASETATERIFRYLQPTTHPLPPPSLCPLKSPVPEVHPQILCDRDGMQYALRSDFEIIIQYASVFSERVSRHLALDLNYVELLPDLYKNEMTSTVLEVACKSMVNPLHKCSSPLIIRPRFEAKARCEIVHRKIEENRASYKQLMIESLLPPAQAVCSSAVHVENAITALVKVKNNTKDKHRRLAAIEVGTSLFYHMSSLINDDTKQYPPTRQFFSSCIEVLGQEFIRNNPEQSQPLLQAMLKTPSLAGFLSPNFCPNMCPQLFVTMYEDTIHVSSNQGVDLAFMLLTKFDVKHWLEGAKPVLSERSQLVSTLAKALYGCGVTPDPSILMVFEIYRVHLQTMLEYQFPDHYGEILKCLLKGSQEQTISPLCWGDFLQSLGCEYVRQEGVSEDNKRRMSTTQAELSTNQLNETIEWLATYFRRERTSSTDLAAFGLYPKWKCYVKYLANFIGFLCGSLVQNVAATCQSGGLDPCAASKNLFQQICEIFTPWVQSFNNNGQILSPFVDADSILASDMIAMFVESLECMCTHFDDLIYVPSQRCLSMFWAYYVASLVQPGTPEHVLQGLHAKLSTLPWNRYHPDLQGLELMLKLKEKNHRSCFTFLGCIFTQMPWENTMESLISNSPPEVTASYMVCLFQLFVKLSKEKSIMEVQNPELPNLIVKAESFPWHYITSWDYDVTIDWLLHNCDSRCVLLAQTADAARILGLIKIAGSFNSGTMVTSPDTAAKRCTYVRCIIQLLCQCSHLSDVDTSAFTVIITNLLTEIETVAGSITSIAEQMEQCVSLTVEVLNILNNCNPESEVSAVITKTITYWIGSSPSSLLLMPLITSACRTLANVSNMAHIIEACMDANFHIGAHLGADGGWGPILTMLQVPELSLNDFLQECLKQGCYLTLYAYILQRLPFSQNLGHELSHITSLVEWTSQAKPGSANESKLFLWWGKVLELLMRQLDFGEDPRSVIRALYNFVPALVTLGEDKASTGLLGAIGLGRRSTLSFKFRLTARAFSTFLICQIPNKSFLRSSPHAPGAVVDPARQSNRSPQKISPSSQAFQAVANLESLKNNKSYADLKQHVEFALGFVSDPKHCIRDANRLLQQLVVVLFPDNTYLDILKRT